ncbi:hypothetical protein PFISCL1PPCAC_1835, partial [Pristionchus fissidentatus]
SFSFGRHLLIREIHEEEGGPQKGVQGVTDCYRGSRKSRDGSLKVDDSGLEKTALCHFCVLRLTVDGEEISSEYKCDRDTEKSLDSVNTCAYEDKEVICSCNGGKCNDFSSLYTDKSLFQEHIEKTMKLSFDSASKTIKNNGQ